MAYKIAQAKAALAMARRINDQELIGIARRNLNALIANVAFGK